MGQKQRRPFVKMLEIRTAVAQFKLGALLRVVAVSGLVALLLAESSLWIVAPLVDPFDASRWVRHYIRREHEPHMSSSVTPEPGLPGMEGIARWTTNNLGFRGDELISPKPVNEFRVFLIGGSTTECLILDDDDSLDAVIQKTIQQRVGNSLEIKVYNAGMSGDRSDDHVAMLTQRIVHLEPNLIVVFAGINDLLAAIGGHDFLHFATRTRPPWMLLVTQSQLGRLAYHLARGQWPIRSTGEEPFETTYRFAVELQKAAAAAPVLPTIDVRAYANNLRTLAGVARGHDVALIFMTQQTTWNSTTDPTVSDWHWLLRVGDVRYSENAMHEALEQMNDVMREVAESMGLSLYDLGRSMPKSSDYFYDDVHFNRNGARVAGTELAELIIPHVVDPR